MVFAMHKFDMYTYGRQVCVQSDHKPLQIMTKKLLLQAPRRLQIMFMQLQRYDYTITYRRGELMQLSDTLSRAASNPLTTSDLEQELETVCAMEQSKIVDPLIQGVAEATAEDPDLQEVLSLIRH